MAHATRQRPRSNRAYTLIEMMIVLIILLVLMALIAPVIGNARNAAKRTTTQQLLNNLAQASQQFELSERRLPGYFPETEIGSVTNLGRGFTSTNNLLLDLAGGIVSTTGNNTPVGSIQVGPTATSTVYVNVGLIGSPTQTKGVVNKGYITLDPKHFMVQGTVAKKVSNVPAHFQLPDLVDGFGQPVLTWRRDAEVSPSYPFAAMDSSTRASFYWASNAAFIGATSLGLKEQDQTGIGQGQSGSLLTRALGDDVVAGTMQGLLGHPAFPSSVLAANGQQIPAAPRGKLLFQSAGVDGTYLSVRDRGGIIATAPASPGHVKGAMDYKSTRDPLDNMDDVVMVAGN